MKPWIYVVVTMSAAALASLITIGVPRLISALEQEGPSTVWKLTTENRKLSDRAAANGFIVVGRPGEEDYAETRLRVWRCEEAEWKINFVVTHAVTLPVRKGQCWSVERSKRRSERDPVVHWVDG